MKYASLAGEALMGEELHHLHVRGSQLGWYMVYFSLILWEEPIGQDLEHVPGSKRAFGSICYQ